MRRRAGGTRRLDEAVRVRGVPRADDEEQVDLVEHLLDGPLAVGGRVADVLFPRRSDLGEATPEGGDDLAGLVDRERRLRDVRELRVLRDVERLDLLDGLHEDGRLGRLAHRPDDLLVPFVADEDDRVALVRVPARLDVHLRHERADGVDDVVAELRGVLEDGRRDTVRGVDDRRSRGYLRLLLDEDRAARLEIADDVDVVDDLLADVDGRAVVLERELDRLDGTLHTGAVAAR